MDPLAPSRDDWSRRLPDLPAEIVCAVCAAAVAEPYGWCAGCRKGFCFPCGRLHFCRPSCPDNGCIAGLCVREVRGGNLSQVWGLPAE